MFNKNKKFFLVLILMFFASGCSQETGVIQGPVYNGQELLFEQDGQIYASDTAGQNIYNISGEQEYDYYMPLWIKEKEKVMFIYDLDDFYEIKSKNLSTNETELLWASKKEPQFISIAPDRNWLIYAEEGNCYIFNMNTKKASKIADACLSVAWSPNSRSFVYAEGLSLKQRDFNINQAISEAKEIYQGEVKGTIFLSVDSLLFEIKDTETDALHYDLYKYSLNNKTLSAVTNLDFESADQIYLELAPDGSKLVYNRLDSASGIYSAWLLNISQTQAIAKLVLNNASRIIWNTESNGYIYCYDELDENGNQTANIYRASKDGLNKEKIIDNSCQISLYHNNKNYVEI